MHRIVKILSSDDGEPTPKDSQVWHLVVVEAGSSCTLCGGEYFGFGESGCEYEAKNVDKGGITCKECLKIIKRFKDIKL